MQDKQKTGQPIDILLVEDSEDDIILTRESFKRSKIAVKLHDVQNGKECMDFLRNQGKYADAPTPDMILLDLNMPVMDGRDVLMEITSDDNLRHLPVVILTTSADEKDILAMYNLRCSSYIVKPVDFDQFVRVINEFSDYWFTVVKRPAQTNK